MSLASTLEVGVVGGVLVARDVCDGDFVGVGGALSMMVLTESEECGH